MKTRIRQSLLWAAAVLTLPVATGAPAPGTLRGHLYGVVPRYLDMEKAEEAYLASISMNTGVISPVWYNEMFVGVEGDGYVLQGGVYRAGVVYVPRATYGVDSYSIVWNAMDLASGKRLSPVEFADNTTYADPYSITYDSKADLIYGVSFNDQSDSNLVVIDPKDGFSLRYVGFIGSEGSISAIAYNPANDTLYAFNTSNEVYAVDTATGEINTLGRLDYDETMFDEGIAGQIAYSPLDGTFVYLYRDPMLMGYRMLFIDPETFEVAEGEDLKGETTLYITNIFLTDPYAEAEAPAQAPECDIKFDRASLSGEIVLHIPSERFDGVLLQDEAISAVATVDGKVVFDSMVAPGSDQSVSLTLEEGVHELSFTTSRGSNGELISPVRTQRFHTGNDNPREIRNLTIAHPSAPEGALVSWDAPEGEGLNFGYVDMGALTYDVYLDDVKQNTAPVAETTFTLDTDRELHKSEIKVVAVCHGKESQPTAVTEIVGRAFTLPVSWNPTREESELFPVVNANEDSSRFYFQQTSEEQYGMTMVIGYYNDPDDWVFLPVMDFEDTSVVYNLAFEAAGVMTVPTVENLDVWVGTAPDPAAMQSCIFSRQNMDCSMMAMPYNANFAVSEKGLHYIGFHLVSKKTNGSRGIILRNFRVRAQHPDSGKAPGEPTEVAVIAGEKGALEATVTMTLPLVDMLGAPMDAEKEMEMKVGGLHETTVITGRPGETVSTLQHVDAPGTAIFTILPSNEYGDGTLRVVSGYVGTDTPSVPRNLTGKVAEDNLSIRLDWDVPGETGIHGGYVNTESLVYPIYMGHSNHTLAGKVDKSYVIFTPGETTLRSYILSVKAENEIGASPDYSNEVREVLGTPYEVPMRERFGSAGFNYSPYESDAWKPGNLVSWENTTSVANFNCGNPTISQGALIAYTDNAVATSGELTLPKAATTGYHAVTFSMKYWDFSEAPERIEIIGRHAANSEPEVIGTIIPSRPQTGEWAQGIVELPAGYMDRGWIQLRVRPCFPGTANQLLCIDEWELIPDVDTDLSMGVIEGPAQCVLGETPEFLVSVVNAGYDRVSGHVLTEVVGESGKLYATIENLTGALNYGQKYQTYVKVPVTGAYAGESHFTIRCTVECEDDKVTSNNTREHVVKLAASQLPVVSDLELNEETSDLVWTEPDATYGGNQDFDILRPFTNEEYVGEFTTYDLDGGEPIMLGSGSVAFLWDGCAAPSSWTVIDAEAIGTMNDERAAPHSGKQYLMARSVNPDYMMQASDWLISPEVKGGSTVSFWYGTLASNVYEYVELWYSASDTYLDPEDYDENASGIITRMGDFHRIRSFSKTGAATWEEVKAVLPENARYFALRYCSFDGYAALIDDLSYDPIETSTWDIAGYSVYRQEEDGRFTHVGDTDTTGFSLKDMASGMYCVRTRVDADRDIYSVTEGPVSNLVSFGTNGVAVFGSSERGVAGGKGCLILKGMQDSELTICTISGQVAGVVKPLAPYASYPFAPGIYLVRTPEGTFKVNVR